MDSRERDLKVLDLLIYGRTIRGLQQLTEQKPINARLLHRVLVTRPRVDGSAEGHGTVSS